MKIYYAILMWFNNSYQKFLIKTDNFTPRLFLTREEAYRYLTEFIVDKPNITGLVVEIQINYE